MHIDSYQFGNVVIDGVSYSSDVIILADCVRSNWWRRQGHSLAVEDLQMVIESQPAILVVGCGASGVMQLPEETREALQQHGIQMEALNTHKAVERFNELSRKGTKVAAALHLTC